MGEPARRRRDPEARRATIVTAAAELIIEVGVDAITHRMVAARAGVPLGATTQYFATLDDLRAAALHLLVSHVDRQMEAIRHLVEAKGATAATLADFISRALADAPVVRADRAVVTAAVHDPRLRELAREWSLRTVDMLAPMHGTDRATAAGVFLDGVMWHSMINDEPLPRHVIQTALAGILGETTTDRSTT